MLWTARADLSCEWVSRGWLEFTGASAEQARGDGWARSVHPEDLARWLDACVRAFDAREPFEIEYRLRRRDGAYRWVLDRGRPRFGADGRFLGFVGACVDIDEKKRAEAELPGARVRGEPLLAGVRVLVVEDDPLARERAATMLRVAGADTRAAASAAEASRTLGAWRPDVLLSDQGMRGEDGVVLVRAAHGGAGAAAGAADARLAKPLEPVALLATVARLACSGV